eukprot:700541-Pelagomonas_calceolata.AAC.1
MADKEQHRAEGTAPTMWKRGKMTSGQRSLCSEGGCGGTLHHSNTSVLLVPQAPSIMVRCAPAFDSTCSHSASLLCTTYLLCTSF